MRSGAQQRGASLRILFYPEDISLCSRAVTRATRASLVNGDNGPTQAREGGTTALAAATAAAHALKGAP